MAIRAEDMWRSSQKNRGDDQRDRAVGRLSDRLFSAAQAAWQEAMKKQFLLEMADGTLSQEHFRYYMLIDYLYLIEYIKTLRIIEERSGRSYRKLPCRRKQRNISVICAAWRRRGQYLRALRLSWTAPGLMPISRSI